MKGRDQSEAAQLKLRLREPLRKRIEHAAERRGISMNSEIVDRLERSFEDDSKIEAVFGNKQLLAIMRLVASVLERRYRFRSGKKSVELSWLEDSRAFDRAVMTLQDVLLAFRPTENAAEDPLADRAPPLSAEEQKAVKQILSAGSEQAAIQDAAAYLRAVLEGDDDTLASRIKTELGPDLVARIMGHPSFAADGGTKRTDGDE